MNTIREKPTREIRKKTKAQKRPKRARLSTGSSVHPAFHEIDDFQNLIEPGEFPGDAALLTIDTDLVDVQERLMSESKLDLSSIANLAVAVKHGVPEAEVTPEFLESRRNAARKEFDREMRQIEKETGVKLKKDTPEFREKTEREIANLLARSPK